jgi:hypothetical protein
LRAAEENKKIFDDMEKKLRESEEREKALLLKLAQ